jgi:hypothetical protein
MPAQRRSNRLCSSPAKLVAIAGLVANCLVPSTPANAGISIDSSAKIMVLFGYSMDLNKQQLTPIHPSLNSLLQTFVSTLKGQLNGSIEYFSDAILDPRLASAEPSNDDRSIKIAKFIVREHYTHLIVANVTTLDYDQQIGAVSLQISSLERYREMDAMRPTIIEAAQSNESLDVVSNGLVTEFIRKFEGQGQQPQRTVHIDCIMPLSPFKRDGLDQTERDQIEMEEELSPRVTNGLITLYKRAGYRPTVDEDTYVFKPGDHGMTCKAPVAVNLSNSLVDYKITGKIGVAEEESRSHWVRVRLNIVRYSPDNCRKNIEIPETFPRSMYYEKRRFSIKFSKDILPMKYEPERVAFESQACRAGG